jgi:hypothetical protein
VIAPRVEAMEVRSRDVPPTVSTAMHTSKRTAVN